MVRTILYLDIDGVLLRRRRGNFRTRDAFEIAPHAIEFLAWAVTHFDVRWLSSRCQTGDSQAVCHAIRYALGAAELPPEWRFVETIPAVRSGARKIDAIDLSSDFLWVDDNHGADAMAILAAHGKSNAAIEVSVDRDPNALLGAMERLGRVLGLCRAN